MHNDNKDNYQYLLDDKKWVKFNKLPSSVGKIWKIHQIDNEFYTIGNKGISTFNDEFYEFSKINKKYYWWHTSCVVGTDMLIFRKSFEKESFCNGKAKLFDTNSKKFIDFNIKTKRAHFAVVCYLNKLWIIGGKLFDKTHELFNTIQVFDPVTKTQLLSPVEMTQARTDHRVVVYKNKLFVFGGSDIDDKPLSSVEMYSPITNEFAVMAPMKVARCLFACCRVGNLVYVIGGQTEGKEVTKSVEVYNLDTDVWTDGVEIPASYYSMHACATSLSGHV